MTCAKVEEQSRSSSFLLVLKCYGPFSGNILLPAGEVQLNSGNSCRNLQLGSVAGSSHGFSGVTVKYHEPLNYILFCNDQLAEQKMHLTHVLERDTVITFFEQIQLSVLGATNVSMHSSCLYLITEAAKRFYFVSCCLFYFDELEKGQTKS